MPQYELQIFELEYPNKNSTSPVSSFFNDKEKPQSNRVSIIKESFKGNSRSPSISHLENLQNANNYAKVLVLKILNSTCLPKNYSLTINVFGAENSARNAKDGVTYFGCKRKNNRKIVNDIVIPAQDKNLANNHRGQHFKISYETEKDAYFIRDLAVGFGSFVRLKYPILLKDNYLFHIGDNFMLMNLIEIENYKRLRVKIFGLNNSGNIFYFEPHDYKNNSIRIGRANHCEIYIEDTLISKIQCYINCKDENWVLYDGDCETERSSTNGTWFYLSEDFEIYDGMIFKSNHSLFQITVV